MEAFQRQTLSIIEERIGYTISYESARPSIFVRLDLYDVSLSDPEAPGDPEQLLFLKHVSVRYSMLDLLRGEMAASVKELVLINSRVDIDLEKDGERLGQLFGGGKPSGIEETGETDGLQLPSLPPLAVSGKNLSLRIQRGQQQIDLDRFYFSLSGGNQAEFECKGLLKVLNRGESWTTDLSAEGRWSGQEANAQLRLDGFISPFFHVPKLRAAISLNDQILLLKKIADRNPFDLDLSYDLRSGEVAGNLVMEEFLPSSFIRLRGGLERDHGMWMENRFSGKASGRFSPESGELSYACDLSGRIRKGPDLGLPFDYHHDISLELTGSKESVQVSRLQLRSPEVEADLSGFVDLRDFTFQTDLDLERFQWEEHRLSGGMSVDYNRESLRVQSTGLQYRSVQLSGIDLLLDLREKGSADYSLNIFFPDTGRGYEGAVYAEGELQYRDGLFVESSLLLDSLPLALLSRELDLPEADYFLSGSLFLSSDLERLSYSTGYIALEDPQTGNYLKFSGGGNLKEHSVRDIELQWDSFRLEGDAHLSLLNQGLLVSGDLIMDDTPFSFSSHYRYGEALILEGDYSSRLGIRFHQDGLYVTAGCSSFPLPIEALGGDLSFQLHGSYRNLEDWELLLDSVELKGADFSLPGGNRDLSLAGLVNARSLYLGELVYSDENGSLAGQAAADFHPTETLGQSRASAWFRLLSEESEESLPREGYRGSLSYRLGMIDARLFARDARLSRLGLEELEGRADGRMAFSGGREDAEIQASVTVKDAVFREQALEAELSAESTAGDLSLLYGRVLYGGHLLQRLKGDLTLQQGQFQLEGEYRPVDEKAIKRLGFSAQGEVKPVESLYQLPRLIESPLYLDLLIDPLVSAGGEQEAQSYRLEKDDREIRLSGGPGGEIEAYYRFDGDFSLDLGPSLPVSAEVRGSYRQEQIDVRMKGLRVDLSILKPILNISFFTLNGGIAVGDLEIRGDARDPEFFGSLLIEDAEAESILFPQGLSTFDAYLRVQDRDMSIVSEPILVEDSTVNATVDLDFDRWIPRNVMVKVQPDPEKGVRVNYAIPGGGVNASGLARGLFIIELKPSLVKLYGDLDVSDADVTLAGGIEDREESSRPGFDLLVDISINIGRRVEFYWPTTSFPILRSFAAPQQELTILYDSGQDDFSLKGDVKIQGGEITYLQRNFLLSRGEILFDESKERFDPVLTVQAVLRDMDDEGEPIKITLEVDEQPLSRFEPKFSSEPAMSDAEIIAVLGSGLSSRLGQETLNITSGLVLTGSLVSQLGILGNFESRVKEVLNLDLFSVRTYMIQNLLVDRVGSAFGGDGGSGDFGQYLDNTTIFLGKYFGNDLFIQGTLQIQSNNVLTDGTSTENELFIDSEISLEWDTPLFLLDFAVRPDFNDPLGSLGNASLGLSWGFSY